MMSGSLYFILHFIILDKHTICLIEFLCGGVLRVHAEFHEFCALLLCVFLHRVEQGSAYAFALCAFGNAELVHFHEQEREYLTFAFFRIADGYCRLAVDNAVVFGNDDILSVIFDVRYHQPVENWLFYRGEDIGAVADML